MIHCSKANLDGQNPMVSAAAPTRLSPHHNLRRNIGLCA